MLEPFGVRELVQSGMVAVGRGPRSITGTALRARSTAPPESTVPGRQSREDTDGSPRCTTTTTPTWR